jgi:hypothetical protein
VHCEHCAAVVKERSRRLVVTAGQWMSGTAVVGSGPRNRRLRTARLARSLAIASVALAIAGCFLMSRAPQRPRPAVSGPVPYVENCVTCHARPTVEHYAESRHAAEGIRCGQCHPPGGHPDFSQPVDDGKCGGCHQPEYQGTLVSGHFASRLQRALDRDRAARASLRRDGFTAPAGNARRFVGDSSSGELGGRLCAACHYDDHRLGLAAVQRANFCVGCHENREQHFSDESPGAQNRCVTCHVRAGTTVAGQVVNTHRFAVPGTEGAGQ